MNAGVVELLYAVAVPLRARIPVYSVVAYGVKILASFAFKLKEQGMLLLTESLEYPLSWLLT